MSEKELVAVGIFVSGGFVALLKYIWNETHKRIDNIEHTQKELYDRIEEGKSAMSSIATQLELIKQDGKHREELFRAQETRIAEMRKETMEKLDTLGERISSILEALHEAVRK